MAALPPLKYETSAGFAVVPDIGRELPLASDLHPRRHTLHCPPNDAAQADACVGPGRNFRVRTKAAQGTASPRPTSMRAAVKVPSGCLVAAAAATAAPALSSFLSETSRR